MRLIDGGTEPARNEPQPAAPAPDPERSIPRDDPADRKPQQPPESRGLVSFPRQTRPQGTSPMEMLVSDSIEASLRAGRCGVAFGTMLCGLSSMINITMASVADLDRTDWDRLGLVTAPLIRSLDQLSAKLKAATTPPTAA